MQALISKENSFSRSPWPIFLAANTLGILLGFFEFFSPISGDTATYAYYAREMRSGMVLYRDLWQFKPPGIYALFSIATTLFPDSPATLRATLLAANLFTSAILYRLLKRMVSHSSALTLAAICPVLLNLSGYFNADGPYPESFIPLFAVTGYYFWLNSVSSGKIVPLFASGLMTGVLLSFKQTAFSLGISQILFFNQRKEKKEMPSLKKTLIFLFGIISVLSAWIFYFTTQGAIKAMIQGLLIFPLSYPATTTFAQFIINLKKMIMDSLIPLSIFWMLIPFGISDAIKSKWEKRSILLWWLVGWIFVLLPGRCYGRYLAEIFVPCFILCAFGLDYLLTRVDLKKRGALCAFFFCFALLTTLFAQAAWEKRIIRYRILEKTLNRTETVREFLKDKKRKKDSIFSWADPRGPYVTGLHSAASFLDLNTYPFRNKKGYTSPLNFEKMAESWCKNPPRYFLDSKKNPFKESFFPADSLKIFLEKNYRAILDLPDSVLYEVTSNYPVCEGV